MCLEGWKREKGQQKNNLGALKGITVSIIFRGVTLFSFHVLFYFIGSNTFISDNLILVFQGFAIIRICLIIFSNYTKAIS